MVKVRPLRKELVLDRVMETSIWLGEFTVKDKGYNPYTKMDSRGKTTTITSNFTYL